MSNVNDFDFQSIEKYLLDQVALLSGKSKESLNIDSPFLSIGLKTGDLISLIADINKFKNLNLSLTLGFDYPTIRTLSEYIDSLENNFEKELQIGNAVFSEELNEISIGNSADPIAVVGIGCRFPGGCDSPDKFWKFLENAEDAITSVPDSRWDMESFYDEDPMKPGKMNTKWGGFLDDIDKFDPSFFGISPREAKGIDPQQRLVMEVSWEALEDAGIIPESLKGGDCGVFVGISGSDYGRLLFKNPANLDLYSGTGNSTSIAANRVSYSLGLRGPSLSIDTACSSSLVAIHVACQSLKNNECSIALAGGVNLILSPEMSIIFAKSRLMSPDGRCKTFDSLANGYVRSEGCGIVALKRYSAAKKDRDRIYGLIRSTHINQDGESNGLTVPNGFAQEMLIKRNLEKAGVFPSEVSYSETHGTGTIVGDPIEVNSLASILGNNRKKDNPLILGSVKTNIGHLEQAAGVAGLIKVMLSLKHKNIPPHLHFKNINPLISLDDIPAIIPTENCDWEASGGSRIATVSGFSFGGVNAHAVVEEFRENESCTEGSSEKSCLLTFSAKDEQALKEKAFLYRSFLDANPEINIANFCYTANAHRSNFSYRASITGKDLEDLKKGLISFEKGKKYPGFAQGKDKGNYRPVFMFTGQGSQYHKMGIDLYENQPVFRKEMDRCNEIFEEENGKSLISMFYAEKDQGELNQTKNTQPALFCLEYSLARMYQSWGIEPSAVMGHSVGEYVAACIAGVFSLEDGLKLITARAELIQNLPLTGKMAALFTDKQSAEKFIEGYSDKISVAAANSPENTVISGDANILEKIVGMASKAGIEASFLNVSHAFHSPLMEPVISEFEKTASSIEYSLPKLPYISNVTGKLIQSDEVCNAQYWCQHILSAVEFESGIKTLHELQKRLYLEIGPNPILSGMAKEVIGNKENEYIPSLKKGADDFNSIYMSIGELYVHGCKMDWKKIYENSKHQIISIPTYPFQKQRYWLSDNERKLTNKSNFVSNESKDFHPSTGKRIPSCLNNIIYQYTCNTESYFLDDHRVYNHSVMSGSTMASMVMHCMDNFLEQDVYELENFFVREALYVPEDTDVILQIVFTVKKNNKIHFKLYSKIVDESIVDADWIMHIEGAAWNKARQIFEDYKNYSFSPDLFKKRLPEVILGESLYDKISSSGLMLGPHFKWLDKIWKNGNEALAELRGADISENYKNGQLPAGLIDSCTQLLFSFFDQSKDVAYMFLGFDTFIFYGNANGRLFCHMDLTTNLSENDLIIGDYRIWNDKGKLVAEAHGVHLKKAPSDVFLENIKKEDNQYFYGLNWLEVDSKPVKSSFVANQSKWIILSDNYYSGYLLLEELKAKGFEGYIFFNEKLDIANDDNNSSVFWQNENELIGLLEKYLQGKIAGIVNLCGLNDSLKDDENSNIINFSSCRISFSVIQTILRLRSNDFPKLWFITGGTHYIEENIINPIQSLLWGVSKTISLEHPELFGGVIDLPFYEYSSVFNNLADEITNPNNEKFISLRHNKKYVQRIEPLKVKLETYVFSKNSTVLITGGLGGLGLEMCKWIVERGCKNIVLTGRRSPSKDIIEKINGLKKPGVEILTVEVDVADAEGMKKLFAEVSVKMAPIKSVFHLAGVLDDGMLHQLEWGNFEKVFTPKIIGTWNLHLLTKDLDLDHFVLFSSVASFLGSKGQANYGAANQFMDSLAEFRKSKGLTALSLNWGPWAEVGMASSLKLKDFERWEQNGIKPFSLDKGFALLEKILGTSSQQVAILDIDWTFYNKRNFNEASSLVISKLIKNEPIKSVDVKTEEILFLDRINTNSEVEKSQLVSREIVKLVAEVMWLDTSVSISQKTSLMEMGLDSLMVIELRNRFKSAFDVNLSLTEFLKTPSINKLTELVLEKLCTDLSIDTEEEKYPIIVPDLNKRFEPFPLTDIQHAYWVGREGSLELGNVSCHVYPEIEVKDLDIERLERAVVNVVNRHEMLRSVVLDDGQQCIKKEWQKYTIKTQDLRGLEKEVAEKKLFEVRNEMSHQILPSETGPLFEIQASLLDNGITRIHISFDLLIGDGWSFNILIKDLYEYYFEPNKQLPQLDLSFRDYVVAEKQIHQSSLYQKSKRYWMDRITELPPAPDLPLGQKSKKLSKHQFGRLKYTMNAELWRILKLYGAEAGLTPSGILIAAFSEILAYWSKNSSFSINLTMFNRLPLHDRVNEIVGDFTTLTLLEINHDNKSLFEKRAQKIQERLWEDLEHRYISGVEVLREMGKQRKPGAGLNFPIVFTSVLPYSGKSDNSTTINIPEKLPVDMVYCISQTPQVWLDHQIFENNGALTFNWDFVEGLFPENMIEEMFDVYCKLINALASDQSIWKEKNLSHIFGSVIQHNLSSEKTDFLASDDHLLHSLYQAQVLEQPNKNAIVTTTDRLAYRELDEISNGIASLLIEEKITPGMLVGVVMARGWEQVAGALGILKSGGAYLPLDSSIPPSRMELILKDADVDIVLVQPQLKNKIEFSENIKVIEVDKKIAAESLPENFENKADANDLAYVIYTSGSTGKPKGVMIDHAGALNTIADINKRFNVTSNDKVISLAAMNFDLSVYDYFGILGAGGTIVIPDKDKANDPDHWLELMEMEKITIWNSVPQLMQMLTDYLPSKPEFNSKNLRLVMMSGDWIPLNLPRKIRENFNAPLVISLGGATEASIWSILYSIEKVDKNWKSIPYGRAMLNQKVMVLNKSLDPCPVWVTGDIYIGGKGLAKGYLNDDEKTNASFITHMETGERLYRTGDLGRSLPDGNIEFLGRDDFQVKIRGYRVELGEIQSIINEHSQVKDSVVTIVEGNESEKNLGAYLILNENPDESIMEKIESSILKYEDLFEFNIFDMIEISNEDSEKFKIFVDLLSIEKIYEILDVLGIFKNKAKHYSLSEILEKGRIEKSFVKLVEEWLEILCRLDLLDKKGELFGNPRKLEKYENSFDFINNFAEGSALRESAEKILKYIEKLSPYYIDVIQGKKDTLELFFGEDESLSPEKLSAIMPGTGYANETISNYLKTLVERGSTKRPLNILEVGGRTGDTAEKFLPLLDNSKFTYTITDSSIFFTNILEEKFKNFSSLKIVQFDVEEDVCTQSLEKASFDVIFASNSIHRTKNIKKTLENINSLLLPGGILIISENTENRIIQKISVGLIEKGFTELEDERAGTGEPLLETEKWLKLLIDSGFEKAYSSFGEKASITGNDVIIARSVLNRQKISDEKFANYLKEKLTSYMIPDFYLELEKIPLTQNGKVDIKSLPVPSKANSKSTQETGIQPATKTEELVAEVWTDILKIDDISINQSFFDIGGDSLVGTRLVARLRDMTGSKISLRILFENPTIKKLASIIEIENSHKNKNIDLPEVKSDFSKLNFPFPVTDVQYAYLMGRSGLFELGKVGAHCYFEYDGTNLDIGRLEKALNRLINHHPMMKSVFLKDGTAQQILKEVPEYKIKINDFRGLKKEKTIQKLEDVRAEMSHQILAPDEWALFDIKISIHGKNEFRLHISLDNSIFDGWSMFHLIGELSRIYRDPEAILSSVDFTFRDYILGMEKLKKTKLYSSDKEYWLERLEDFPASPDLPMSGKPEAGVHYPFSRFEFKLENKRWEKLKQRAKNAGLTPSGLLLSAYCEVLNSRSGNNKFTINLTTFNRVPFHDHVTRIIGDFTSLSLLAVDNNKGETFKERAKKLQKQLWEDIDHPYYSGVEVLRELGKIKGGRENASMPIVFTSALGFEGSSENDVEENYLGKLNYNISQTPQVLLDHQVYETSKNLVLIWDTTEELFPEDFMEDMFSSYINFILKLLDSDELWEKKSIDFISEKQKLQLLENNEKSSQIPEGLLHSAFLVNAEKNPKREAIRTPEIVMTYGELFARANNIAGTLMANEKRKNALVAVVMEKGWEQVVAVTGILMGGYAYLPITPDTPAERLKHLFNECGVENILTQSQLKNEIEWPENCKLYFVDKLSSEKSNIINTCNALSANDLAYVIYTSGSTGLPKGVMLDHKGPLNTIIDINNRFNINESDKILFLADLNFDLSVYDIFGSFAAGATLVIPEHKKKKEPSHWVELFKNHKITVWNSVPQLMQMFTDHLITREDILPQSLRLSLLSGDWVPSNLPGKINSIFKESQVVSLGGATEASIWSILYEVKDFTENLEKIPYGKPMENQKFYVLNKNMENCPVWVTGDLYIGGVGLAKGYFNDKEKTDSSFIKNPHTNEFLYSTGDLGRFLPDGNIEFIGRSDNQVKIRGYRVELGEIESVLKTHPGIKDCAVKVFDDEASGKKLAAFMVKEENEVSSEKFESSALGEFLKRKVYDYMVPGIYVFLDEMPLNNNGKIDRKALLVSREDFKEKEKIFTEPRNYYEKEILEMWKEALAKDEIDIFDNFFETGGDSLIAVQLLNDFYTKFDVEIPLLDLFEAPTIVGMAEAVLNAVGTVQNDSDTYSKGLPDITPDVENSFSAFPLTDVQQAYWIGRTNAYELGNVATHTYFELENTNVDIEKFNYAWNKVIERHGMLRAVVLPDGNQQILEKVEPYDFKVYELEGKSKKESDEILVEIRNEMEDQILDTDCWPLFDIRVSKYGEGVRRIHLSFDALIVDGWSMGVIFKDLYHYYNGNREDELEALEISYRDYVKTEEVFRTTDLYKNEEKYFLDRLSTFPPSPDLPLEMNPSDIEKPIFSRLSFILEKEKWENFKKRAIENNLTPTGLLIGAYAKVLSLWSEHPEFTINLSFFNRLPMHDQVNLIVGDFTSIKLLPVLKQDSSSFKAWVESIQDQLWKELDHRYFSGVQVIRELSQRSENRKAALMPVVFTSMLGLENKSDEGSEISKFGELIYNVSQTPQVYLDNQVSERNGNLSINWDVVEELFPDGLLQLMFEAYSGLIDDLSKDEFNWEKFGRDLIPENQKKKRLKINSTDAEESEKTLHSLFIDQYRKNPDKKAIITSKGSISYGGLFNYSGIIAEILMGKGVKSNKLVAIVMDKGVEQIAGAMGILMSGGAYLPVSPDVPGKRLALLLEDGEVDFILTQSWLEQKLTWPEDVELISVDTLDIKKSVNEKNIYNSNHEDLAYVIYTSGSTGKPKGVVIDHKGVVNTILDINRKFGINEDDNVFALSALNFDLSVYDVFGSLGAGATIVLPDSDKTKEPKHWADLICENKVTIWNSVPTLIRMLVEYLPEDKKEMLSSLRLALLSGDWIPLELPEQLRKYNQTLDIISLGGATEASIWSIYYPIGEVASSWKSVPYGKPLDNQQFYVLNNYLENCPDLVAGDLYIGGTGLAKGYWKDERKTNTSFINHPETNERLYKTGDRGRYLPDGNIEFIGREDNQVKINGYRVELGEIETIFNDDLGVKNALAVVAEDNNQSKHIVSYLQPDEYFDCELFQTLSRDRSLFDKYLSTISNERDEFVKTLLSQFSKKTYSDLQSLIDGFALDTIRKILVNFKLFTIANEKISLKQILDTAEIDKRFEVLVAHWLSILETGGLLNKDKENIYSCSIPLSEYNFAKNKGDSASEILQNLKKIEKNIPDYLTGKKEIISYLMEENNIFGADILSSIDESDIYFCNLIHNFSLTFCSEMHSGSKIKILEIGTRVKDTSENLLNKLTDYEVEYVYCDESQYFLDEKGSKYSRYPFFSTKKMDMNISPVDQGIEQNNFDLVIANNTLHRSVNINKTMKYIKSLLNPGGCLIMLESNRNSNLELITTGLFEYGKKVYQDFRNELNRPLIGSEDWAGILSEAGFEKVLRVIDDQSDDYFGKNIFACFAPLTLKTVNPDKCREFVSARLPDYMVPVRFVKLDDVPLTANGKVDRKRLADLVKFNDYSVNFTEKNIALEPKTDTEKILYEIWKEVLNQEINDINLNFFDLGGDSLLATKMMNLIREKFKIEISLQSIFEDSTIYKLAMQVDSILSDFEDVEEGMI